MWVDLARCLLRGVPAQLHVPFPLKRFLETGVSTHHSTPAHPIFCLLVSFSTPLTLRLHALMAKNKMNEKHELLYSVSQDLETRKNIFVKGRAVSWVTVV